ncbi:MAG TPA: fumarylacetoacetase [Burkholderiales bacterium]|nr:fumarylacetoacetase [Burkholderiales bacterium]
MDRTHDPELRSWVETANQPSCDFPIQNLPFGVFRRRGAKEAPRGGVAIGDRILDLAALGVKTGPTLNSIAAMGRAKWKALRKSLSEGLSSKSRTQKRFSRYLVPMKQAELLLPLTVGDYSDFFAGIYHAQNTGRMFRPDNPLLPNYKWVPIGYHGRASSIVVSGTPVKRPSGQVKSAEHATPAFQPSRRLDYECELGFVIGPGNALGRRIEIGKAESHIFGVVLLNDWSARDIQAWEYVPLGPFLAKSFATTISPWIVTMEALEPFRCASFARAADDPQPLEYLKDDEGTGFDITVEMFLRTAKQRAAQRLSRGSFRDSYWTPAQIVAHQSSNGCNLRPGDILGSGTLSGATPDSLGSLLELSAGGKSPLSLPSGETRTFLEDGDEVIQRGYCERDGAARIGFGEAAGKISG